jgi:anti-sigma regulatory factor (Ser/Thr protein kinase)
MVAVLADAGCRMETIENAKLLESELVGNAIRHARTDFTITVRITSDLLRIEVFDRDSRPPALIGLDADATSGRGLNIVAALSSDWGWRTAHDVDGITGKVVWAEVRLMARSQG